MKITQQILTTSLVAAIICISSVTFAGETALKSKSEGLAWVLALDPIPGDALFYAGKPIQGTTSFLLGTAFAVPFYFLVAYTVTGGPEDCKKSGDEWCLHDPTDLLLMTGIPYFATLVWDGIGGMYGVKKQNAEIEKKKHSFLTTFQPTLAVTSNGTFVGGQFRF